MILSLYTEMATEEIERLLLATLAAEQELNFLARRHAWNNDVRLLFLPSLEHRAMADNVSFVISYSEFVLHERPSHEVLATAGNLKQS